MTANRAYYVFLLCLACTAIGLSCSSSESTFKADFAEVRVVVGAASWPPVEGFAQLEAPVPMDDIETFLIDVDRILICAEDDSAEAEEGFVDAGDDSSNWFVIFDSEEQPSIDNEIDLVDLANLSDIISASEVPPGDYTKVALEISNPRLMLAGETPLDYLTNIQLTANGRLFSSLDLLLVGGETANLEVLVHDIHLVKKGNGDFVLTPQLRVELVEDL